VRALAIQRTSRGTGVPRVGALNDPAARLATNATDKWLLAAPANVRRDAAPPISALGVLEVVALVEAEMLRGTWAASAAQHDSIERCLDAALVVHVGTGHDQRKREFLVYEIADSAGLSRYDGR
jgi:hypothetical protein